MAFQTIHTFDALGETYRIQWDDTTDVIHVINALDEVILLSPLSSAELGYAEGHELVATCRGVDLVQIKIRYTYPFAEVTVTFNSPSCAPPPTCDIALISVVHTDETAQGMHDGTVTINATASSSLVYSLDGVNWQAGNAFTNLLPGNYIAYARQFDGCERAQGFTIAPGPPQIELEYPSLDRPCHFFELEYDGVVYEDLAEPARWDNVNFVGKRDREWHGYRGMWSDGIIELEFDCAAGKEVLETAYATHGNDAEVLFRYGYTYKGNKVVLFPGKINFNTYKAHPQKIAVSVEKADFNQSLLTRMDAKVSMAAAQGVDGAAITPPAIINTTLHAKELKRRFQAVSTTPVYAEMPAVNMQGLSLYVQPDTIQAALNEIEDSYPQPFGFSTEDPVATDKYIWDNKYNGIYDYHVEYAYHVNFSILRNTAFGNVGAYTVQTFFQINNNPVQLGPTQTRGFTHVSNREYRFSFAVNVSQSFTGLSLVPGDKVYIYTKVVFSNNDFRIWGGGTQTAINITIQSLERTGETACKSWLLYDVINHCTRVITNNAAMVRSNFLSLRNAQQATDGSGSLYLTTNGKQIRAFAVDTSPLTISLKEVLTSIKNIFCLGYSIERVGQKDVVRIERVNYFYQNRQIIIIEECAEYREEVAKDMLYNEIEIGYEKYQDSGYNTLDEFNTRHEYLTPIKTNKLKLVAKSNLITSGYSIEDVRRQQYAATATNSYQHDDDAFLISVKRSGSDFIPERDEAFEKVENIISPSTAYNLRLSPLRMLLNWAIWLKGIFFYKAGSEKIKNTFVAQNGELITRLSASDPSPIGDINRLEWQEKQDIDLSNYEVEERIYRPEYIYFKCRLTPDRIQYIDKCMRGADTANNYGYILVKDSDGVYQAGWLLEMEYNYAEEKASFKLLKKWDSPVDPNDDCCEHLVVNGCYIKINDKKLIV